MADGEIVRVPPRVRKTNLQALGIEQIDRPATVELRIRTDATGLRVRDLANYLLLVDRLYGRLDRKGLRSYAQRPRDQLQAERIQQGSLELIFQSDPNLLSQENLVLLWTLLAGLGSAGVAISAITKNYARTFNEYQQGRLARAQRRELERSGEHSAAEVRAVRGAMRRFLEEDPRFAPIPPDRRAEIARHLASAYLSEKDQIRSIRHFANERVYGIILRINGRDVSDFS